MIKPAPNNAVIHPVDPKDYHGKQPYERGQAEYVMSRGELRKFAHCPRKWRIAVPQEPTKAMVWGSMVDALALTPDLYKDQFVTTPEQYETTGMKCPSCGSITDSKKCRDCKCDRIETTVIKPWSANSETCKEWIENQGALGKTIVDGYQAKEVDRAVLRLTDEQAVRDILDASRTQVQVNVEWHDSRTGFVIPLKCLIDILPDPASSVCGDTIFDLKTTNDAGPRKWQRQVYTDGLHYQAALYLDAVNAATGCKYARFGHVIQESVKPYEPVVRLLDDEFLAYGRQQYQADLEFYCECLAKQQWPGYDSRPAKLEAWMIKDE